MLEYNFQSDVYKAICAAAWIMFFLILKNLVLLIVFIVQRRKHYIYQIPEDANKFGSGQQLLSTEDWSLAGRIQRTLANDVEYIPYFFFLLLLMFCRVDLVSQTNHRYLARTLIYGVVFTLARYLHTIGYLIKNSYGRILGFLLTIIILIAISIDHVYYMSKALHNFTQNRTIDE